MCFVCSRVLSLNLIWYGSLIVLGLFNSAFWLWVCGWLLWLCWFGWHCIWCLAGLGAVLIVLICTCF